MLLTAALGYGGYSLWVRGMLPANQVAQDWYEATSAGEPLVQLPRDDAPHSNYMEWWYYNGHLDGEQGRGYSFHLAFFQINDIWTHTVAHVSLLDHQTGRYYRDQKRSTGIAPGGQDNHFDLSIGEWRVAGREGSDQLRVITPELSFDLNLHQSAPTVLQGGSGLLDFKKAGKSFYYSRPRMDIDGFLKVSTGIEKVSGVAWFDHQWGDFRVNQLGWDWFAIQLDKGTNIMIYQLFDNSGLPVHRSGTHAEGTITEVLTDREFTVTVTDHWRSPATGVTYPIAWRIEIPSKSIALALTPVAKNSEFDGRTSAYALYWEGPVRITGTHGGRGFVELAGYQKLSKDTPAATPPKK